MAKLNQAEEDEKKALEMRPGVLSRAPAQTLQRQERILVLTCADLRVGMSVMSMSRGTANEKGTFEEF